MSNIPGLVCSKIHFATCILQTRVGYKYTFECQIQIQIHFNQFKYKYAVPLNFDSNTNTNTFSKFQIQIYSSFISNVIQIYLSITSQNQILFVSIWNFVCYSTTQVGSVNLPCNIQFDLYHTDFNQISNQNDYMVSTIFYFIYVSKSK